LALVRTVLRNHSSRSGSAISAVRLVERGAVAAELDMGSITWSTNRCRGDLKAYGGELAIAAGTAGRSRVEAERLSDGR
jgi:hypothetical protein